MSPKIKLYNAAFELTTACPCRCEACGSDAGAPRKDELTTNEWLAQVDAIKGLGAKRLCLLGGEPFLHAGWFALVSAATKAGIDVDVISCGLGISERVVNTAWECGLRWVTISIDGTEAVHDRLRRVSGGFRESLQAVRRLDTAGFKVGITTQVNRRTLPTLEALAEELELAGAFGWQLQLTIPSGRARTCADLILAPTEMPQVFEVVRRLVARRGLRPFLTDGIGYMTQDEPLLRTPTMCPVRCWCGCSAGLRAVGITSRGDVKGCLSLTDEFIDGNVREEALSQIWNDLSRFAYNRAYDAATLSEACGRCELASVCRGGCSSTSVAATGKPNQGTYCVRLQGVI